MCREFADKTKHQDQNRYTLFDMEKKTDPKQGFFDFTVVDQVKKKDGSRDFVMRHHNEMTEPLKLGELRTRYNVAPIQVVNMTEEAETERKANEHFRNKGFTPFSQELLQKVQRAFYARQYRNWLFQRNINEPGSLDNNEKVMADIAYIDTLRFQYKQQYINMEQNNAPFEGSLKRLIDSHTEQLKELKKKDPQYIENFRNYSKNEYYKGMNGYLRDGDPQTNDKEKKAKIIKMCDDLMGSLEEFRLEEDMTLTRHMGIDGLVTGLGLNKNEITSSKKLFEALQGMKVHRVISADKAFCSTTLNPDGVQGFNGYQVECRILAPKGTRGACIRNISRYKHEDEVLLQTNSKLQLLGIRDDGEWTDPKKKTKKDRKIVVYLRAVPDDFLQAEDVKDNAMLNERYQEDYKKQAAFNSSRYELLNSASKADLKPSLFGYSSTTKRGQRVIKMKSANAVLWSDAVNNVNNRCMMILAIYYSRNRDKTVLDGNELKSKEIMAIQKEVENALSSSSVNEKTQDKLSRLLLEMRAGIAVNLTSRVMGDFRNKSKSLAGMSSALPYMQIVMLMQKAFDEICSSIKHEGFRNRFNMKDSHFVNESWKKKFDKLSMCSNEYYGNLLSYRKLMNSSDPVKEQRNKGVNVDQNPFGGYEDHLRNAFKSFCS